MVMTGMDTAGGAAVAQYSKYLLEEAYPPPGDDDPYEDAELEVVLPSDRGEPEEVEWTIQAEDGKKSWTFDPLATLGSQKTQDIGQWRHYVNTAGQSYYYLTRGELRYFSYLTEYVPASGESELDWFIAWIEQSARGLDKEKRDRFPADVEVVLITNATNGNRKNFEWSYYMVDIDSQTVFSIHEAEVSKKKIQVFSDSTIDENPQSNPEKRLMKIHHTFFVMEYWRHVKLFSSHRKPSREMEQAMNILSSRLIKNAIDPREDQNALLDMQDIQMSLDLFRKLYRVQQSERPSGYFMACIADIMLAIERDRFRKLCGERRNQRTCFAMLLIPLLLNKPSRTLKHMEDMFKDNLVSKQEWTTLHEKLEKESSVFAIYATVLLAVDISFLAVPSVVGTIDQNTLSADQTTLTALTAQMSMITCLGSIVLGLLSTLQERVDTEDKANAIDSKAFSYITGKSSENSKGRQRRLEILAIQYSLPFGLLLWGVLFFFVSIMASFFDPNFTIVGITARSWILGAISVIVAVLVIWTIAVGVILNAPNPELPWYTRLYQWLTRSIGIVLAQCMCLVSKHRQKESDLEVPLDKTA